MRTNSRKRKPAFEIFSDTEEFSKMSKEEKIKALDGQCADIEEKLGAKRKPNPVERKPQPLSPGSRFSKLIASILVALKNRIEKMHRRMNCLRWIAKIRGWDDFLGAALGWTLSVASIAILLIPFFSAFSRAWRNWKH